jgi:short-subunit dehydrogenase
MVVLITGASGGLGQVLGGLLQSKGMKVYGTTRNPAAMQSECKFPLLPMEATNDESVQACINTVIEKEGRIDVLITCVNQMIIGSIEEQTVEEVQDLFNANIFGVMRVCKEVIPHMRSQGEGTIVNMSSLGGILAVPYMSAYTSAKFCLEAMSEAMYHEMKPHNINVVIMQPVAMNMDRPATGGHLRIVENVPADSFTHKMVKKMAADTAASKLTPEMVSEKIYQVITSKKKSLRVPMDKSKAVSILKRVAPQSVIDKLIGSLLAG